MQNSCMYADNNFVIFFMFESTEFNLRYKTRNNKNKTIAIDSSYL